MWQRRTSDEDRTGRALFILGSDRLSGTERVTLNLALAAARSGRYSGVDCLVLCSPRTGALTPLEDMEGVRVTYCHARGTFMGMFPLLRFLAGARYAFVFSSYIHVNAACSLMRRLGFLNTGHLVSRESTLVFDRDFGLIGHLVRRLYWLYGGQNLIVCQTMNMLRALAERLPPQLASRLEMIPNPVDMTWIEMGCWVSPPEAFTMRASSRPILVWIGRLGEIKNPLLAIDTLQVLHARGLRSAQLMMIGEGPLRSMVADHAERKGISGHVTMLGKLDLPSVVTSRSDIGLVTSKVEGFPNVVVEMLAAGTRAVVATPCWDRQSDLPDTYVTRDHSPEALADEVMRALTVEPDGKARQRLVAERSPDSYLKRIDREYEFEGAKIEGAKRRGATS